MKSKIWLAVIIILVIILAYVIVNLRQVPENILDVNLRDHTQVALHIHPELEIQVNGERYAIPAGIGISQAGMRVIHTHDETGKLHVESPYPYQFHLRDFFTVWGKRFDSGCVLDFCSNETHVMRVFVDGVESSLFGEIPLVDGERILITYSSR